MDGGALFVVQSILRLWLVVAGLLDPITVVTPLSASSPVSDVHAPDVPQGVGVSAPSFSPLYQQIKGLILRGLQAGEWRPGEAIPSEIDLAARYKVSQGTVRKAIDELAAENLLMRRQGKGTFVSTHAEERVQYRFLRLTPDLPIQQEPSQREFLDCRRLKAPADVAKVLNLPLGGDVIEIRTSARSFLHRQVRSMVGSLIEVGRGREPEGWMADILAAADRTKCGPVAPADGLYLESVSYEPLGA